eukprot:TRINITY_DN3383_c0_g1_i2.p1 TRINITY_DN3383_c0_g1~~TRINITY_DN3383_c0_g1_i2.p1  ORF type:complete len:435 (-),score=97.06 TRINITY_DN3383_c0_g1_i2:56-1360(-)
MLEEGFEGPEKRLEVEFELDSHRHHHHHTHHHHCTTDTSLTDIADASPAFLGMRTFSRDQWQSLLALTGCTILNVSRNDHWDAYLLSESSLFVAPTRVILKTCGRTLPLCGLDLLIDFAKEVGLHVRRLIYLRKNYTFPTAQKYPHRDFSEEASFLRERYPQGRSYEFGPQCTDHWLAFAAGTGPSAGGDQYLLLEIKMHELDNRVMRRFLHPEGATAVEATVCSGIQALLPDMRIDPYLFEPCGYSMNGLQDAAYSTIHITPEPHCSYVSYEALLVPQDTPPQFLAALIRSVLETFRPASFTCATVSSAELPLRSVIRAGLPFSFYENCEFERVYSCSSTLDCGLHMATEMVALLPCFPSESRLPAAVAQSTRRLRAVAQHSARAGIRTLPAGCTIVAPFSSLSLIMGTPEGAADYPPGFVQGMPESDLVSVV